MYSELVNCIERESENTVGLVCCYLQDTLRDIVQHSS